MPANGQAASSSFLKSWFATPAGPANNDVFSSQNQDAIGSIAYASPAPNDKPDVAISKTTTSAASSATAIDSYGAATEKNTLYKYRSWVYNFTLGALSPRSLNDNTLLSKDIKQFTILDSAGKGTRPVGIGSTVGLSTSTNKEQVQSLIDGFQKNSSGHYDMFIDNVQIKTIAAAGSPQTGPSIATNITFDVYEPYGMAGFIEALQTTAKAAGYSDYVKGVFALRVQFQGYPDNQPVESSKPEVIQGTTRYFILTITSVNVDVTEAGTRYKVEAVPQPQMGFGLANKLSADIKVSGSTVGEVLTNFATALGEMTEAEAKARTGIAGNKYQISAPKLSTVLSPQSVKAALLTGTFKGGSEFSEIVKSKMNDDLKTPNIFKMADPAQFKNGYVDTRAYSTSTQSTAQTTSTNAARTTPTPKDQIVVFSAGSLIHECIAAIVRESYYTRDLMKEESLLKAKNKDGLLTYFNVRLESDLGEFNPVENSFFHTWRYVLEPFQIHFTSIPGQDQGTHDVSPIKAKIKREYNYIYSGKNEDITKFNLNFNNLYFSAMPTAGGNPRSDVPASGAAAPGNQPKVIQGNSNAGSNNTDPNSVGTAPTTQNPDSATRGKPNARASNPQGDAYATMALALHEKVMGNVDMIQGTLEILGDPYFLTTGGMGNGDLKLAEQYLTALGPDNTGHEAPTTQGNVYININFRNPIDIDPNTGMLKFSDLLSYSGIYQVIELENHFKDGMFTQSLNILRVPGQTVGKATPNLAPALTTSPYPGLQVTKDSASSLILKAGIRPSDFNLINLLNRGLPSIGLPGNLSNFTNAISGAGASVLSQVSGIVGSANALTNQLGVSPIGGVNALTSGIRLSASGLGSLTAIPNLAASNIAAAGSSIGSLAAIPNAVTGLATNVGNSIASVASAASSNVSSLVQSASNLASNAATNAASLVGGVTDKITSLQNTIPTDINAVASKLGFDPAVLSGLSTDLASKVADQLSAVAATIPPNTNLTDLVAQGVSFASITGDKIPNLPAIQPKASALVASLDPALSTIAQSNGSVSSLLNGSTNLPNLTDINKVTNSLGASAASLASGFGSAESLAGAVGAAQSFVNQTVGDAVGVANNIGSMAQNTINGIMPASVNLGSIESNLTNIANLTQNPTAAINKLGISVAAQFGSLQQSPLTKLVQNSNITGSV